MTLRVTPVLAVTVLILTCVFIDDTPLPRQREALVVGLVVAFAMLAAASTSTSMAIGAVYSIALVTVLQPLVYRRDEVAV